MQVGEAFDMVAAKKFTDKTGTLTKGKLRVIKIIDGDSLEYKNESQLEVNKKYYDILKEACIVNNESVYDNNNITFHNLSIFSILIIIMEIKHII